MVRAGQLDQLRARYVLSQVPAASYGESLVVDPVQNEGRDADRGEHMPDVDLGVNSRKRGEPRRAGTQS